MELAWLDKISLLSSFALSVLILAFAFAFKNDNPDLKNVAAPFLFPALLATTPFFLPPGNNAALIFLLTGALPPLFLAAALWRKALSFSVSFALQLLLIGSVALLITGTFPAAQVFAGSRFLIFAVLAVSAAAALYLHFQQKPGQLISSLLLMGAAQIALFLGQPWLYALGLFAAFLLVFLFLLSELHIQFHQKFRQAEERTQQWDRTVRTEVMRRTLEMERINQRLAETARTDPLTGLLNKAAILEEIENAIQQCKGSRFTVLLFDIDDFKIINDQQGHLAGDEVIRQIARLASTCIRERDRLGRYGGDEFVIVLPQTGLKDATYVGKRLGQRIADVLPPCTISIGIAVYPIDGSTVQDLIMTADNGLYESKRRGKNTVSYLGYAEAD